MIIDQDGARGMLKMAGVLVAVVSAAMFAYGLPREGGMKKDRVTGIVYEANARPADASLVPYAAAVGGLSVLLLISSSERFWRAKKRPNSERSAAPERAAGRGLNKPRND